jgi:2'-5' RNA ligase
MKIFSVYGRLNLTKKPEWLDAFRAKYGTISEYHVTLKQPCFIEVSQIPDIKDKLDDIFGNFTVPGHRIDMIFDRPYSEKDAIMILAQETGPIMDLQKQIRTALKDYDRYVEPELKTYEYDFHPHVSIVMDLTPEQYAAANKELEPDYLCEGVIDEIVLVMVDAGQAGKPADSENQVIYRL